VSFRLEKEGGQLKKHKRRRYQVYIQIRVYIYIEGERDIYFHVCVIE